MMDTGKPPSELEEAARNQGPASSVKSGLSELIGGGGNAGGALETPASSQAGAEQLTDSTQPKKSRTEDAAAGGKPSAVEGDPVEAVEGGSDKEKPADEDEEMDGLTEEVQLSDGSTIDLPRQEFDDEIQSKLMRWSPELSAHSLTLYLSMPRGMPPHIMLSTARAALGQRGEMLDARCSAGSRVVVRALQTEVRSWIGIKNYYQIEGEDEFRGIWCSNNSYAGVSVSMNVADSSLTVVVRGVGKYEDHFAQQKLFSAVRDAASAIMELNKESWSDVTMDPDKFGVSAADAYAAWSATQSRSNDRGYVQHYRKYVWQWDGFEHNKQASSHSENGDALDHAADCESMSSRIRMPTTMVRLMMGDDKGGAGQPGHCPSLEELVTKRLRTVWADAECLVFPSVPERASYGCMEMEDGVVAPVQPRNVVDAGMEMRRFKIVSSEGTPQSVRGPVPLARMIEDRTETLVSSIRVRAQKVNGMPEAGVVTVIQAVLVGTTEELDALAKSYGSGGAASAIPGYSFSEWKAADKLKLTAGVNIWTDKDGKVLFGRVRTTANQLGADHYAAFKASLNESISNAHAGGLQDAIESCKDL